MDNPHLQSREVILSPFKVEGIEIEVSIKMTFPKELKLRGYIDTKEVKLNVISASALRKLKQKAVKTAFLKGPFKTRGFKVKPK
jgi:hypothetical protein